MSKEEILDMWAKDKMVEWDINKFRKEYPSLYAVILQSMSTHSKQEAIEFAEWIDENLMFRGSERTWVNAPNDEFPNTQKLYELYLQSKNKQ